MQRRVIKLIEEVAKQLELSPSEVEKLVRAEFQLIKRVMKEGSRNQPETFKNVRLIKFGLFGVKPGRIEKLRKYIKQDGYEQEDNIR